MPTYTRHAVVGYFNDNQSAQAALNDLVENGFSRERVHLSSSNDYATDAATGGAGLTGRAPAEREGGISGWFRSLFGSDEYDTDATRYSERARSGGSVVAVDATDEDRDRAVEVLNEHGASDIDEGENNTNSTAGIRDTNSTLQDRGKRTIPVVQEELNVGKRPVQSGGVRIYSRAVNQPVEEQVTLRQERVVVDRQPVNRDATSAEEAAWRDQTIDVVEMTEEPVIQKRARVVEEVRVGKEATERTETVRDNVRHTEVKTEPIGGSKNRATTKSSGTSDYGSDYQTDFQSRYGKSGGDYGTYAPAYEYGSTMAADPRYQGKNWNDIEPTLRSDYGRRYPESSWDRMKDAVRYGWDKVTGQR